MQTYHLVVLGDGGVGKTALTIQLALNHFITAYDPTIEDCYRKHANIDGQPCLIEILDTAGQEAYTALRDSWIREGEAFLLVYSITQRSTFDGIERYKQQILRVKDRDDIPMILVGNKCDKATDREVSQTEAAEMARYLSCPLLETSAKTRENLEEAYYSLIRMIRNSQQGLEPPKKQRKRPKCTIL